MGFDTESVMIDAIRDHGKGKDRYQAAFRGKSGQKMPQRMARRFVLSAAAFFALWDLRFRQFYGILFMNIH